MPHWLIKKRFDEVTILKRSHSLISSVALMALLTPLLSFANPPDSNPPPTNPAEEEVPPEIVEVQKKALTEILKPLVWELDRNILTFHYEQKNDKNVPENWEQVQEHILKYPGRFFDANYKDGNMMGPGLYVAIDPVASRGFGGNSPLLYSVQLKKGARILRSERRDMSSNSDLEEIWKVLKCKNRSNSGSPSIWGLSSLIGLMRGSESLHCRKVIVDIVQNLNIEAFEYGYSAANDFSGSCRAYRGYAFNIIKPTALATEGMNFYADDFKLEKQKLTPLLNLLYTESAQDLSLIRWDNLATDIVGSLQTPTTAPLLLYDLWRNKMIFQCGPKWGSEKLFDKSPDKDLGDVVKNYYRFIKTFKDRDFMKRAIEAKKMLKKKFLDDPNNSTNYFNFDYAYLKTWVLQSMKIAGEDTNNPATVGNWNAAFLILRNYNKTDFPKAVTLLNEDPSKIPPLETLDDKFTKLLIESIKKSKSSIELLQAYVKGMEEMGFGPRFILAHLQFKFMSEYFSTPILTGDLRNGIASLLTEPNLKSSMEAGKETLRKCMTIYEDPNSKYADIVTGPCGF